MIHTISWRLAHLVRNILYNKWNKKQLSVRYNDPVHYRVEENVSNHIVGGRCSVCYNDTAFWLQVIMLIDGRM
jgi:hypothetical protein